MTGLMASALCRQGIDRGKIVSNDFEIVCISGSRFEEDV